MENYRQDFGFYRSKEPISLIAGKILSALQPGHPDESCMSDTLQEKYHVGILQPKNSKTNGVNTDMDYWNYKKEQMFTEEETQSNHDSSEVQCHDTLYTGSCDESSNTELPVKLQVMSPSWLPKILIRSDVDEDHVHPFMNIPSNIEQEDGESKRQKKNLFSLDRNAERLLLPSLELKRHPREKPEMSFAESEVKRKCSDKSDGIKLWNIWSMNQEQQGRLLDETGQAQAIVLTMLFQNGSSQICPSKDENTIMNGILVLIKKKTDLVSTDAEIYHADNTYIHMTITDNAAWDKDEVQQKTLRTVLLHILQSRAPLICFNAKDFLRTIYGKFLNFRDVATHVILDPRIAAWLLNPADSSPSFEDLVSKHCATLDVGSTGNAPDTRVCIISISALVIDAFPLSYRLHSAGVQIYELWYIYRDAIW